MKHKNIKNIILVSLLLSLTSCNNYKTDNISFKEYTNIISSMEENEKCIVLFSQDNCGYCKILRKSLNKYIKNDKEDNINIYRVDLSINKGNYKDSTIGLYKDPTNDYLLKLDKRIAKYKNECNISYDDLNDLYDSTFEYICTPMFIFYEGKKECYINNNFSSILDENNNVDYDAFVSYMSFKDTYKYSKEFDIEYYEI